MNNTIELPPIEDEKFPLSAAQVGMLCVMACESVMFASLLIAYLIYMNESVVGPYPKDVLSLPLAFLNTVFLVSSSFTIERAIRAIHHKNGANGHAGHHASVPLVPTSAAASTFRKWMLVTMVLAALFLCGTLYEWKELIFDHGLTLSRNLFGTTYFTLIGCHAIHVAAGITVMALFFALAQRGKLAENSEGPMLLGWYWHLVDGVWIVLLLVVYIFGR